MSAPAEKARSPAPVRMTALTPSSASYPVSASSTSCISGKLSALSLSGPVQRDQRDAVGPSLEFVLSPPPTPFPPAHNPQNPPPPRPPSSSSLRCTPPPPGEGARDRRWHAGCPPWGAPPPGAAAGRPPPPQPNLPQPARPNKRGAAPPRAPTGGRVPVFQSGPGKRGPFFLRVNFLQPNDTPPPPR